MTYEQGRGGRVVVANPGAFSTAVSITAASGRAITVYTDTARSVTVTMPDTITATKQYYLDRDDAYVISAKVNGIECGIVGTNTTPITELVSGDTTEWINVDRELAQATASAAYVASTKAGREVANTLNATALRPFLAALANRDTAAVDVMIVGDSFVEGQGSSAVANRWVDKFTKRLRAQFQAPGVRGGGPYQPGWYAGVTGYTNPATAGGAAAQDASYGLGRRDLKLAATGDTATWTFTGTGCRLLYGQNTVAGTFSVAIDGGAPTTLTTTGGSITSGSAWESGPLARGAHTVVATWISGTNYVEGIYPYDGDETTGIRVWEGGHSGYTSGQFMLNTFWAGVASAIQPSLIVISLGVNDFRTSVSSATFQTNITSMITTLRAKCTVPPAFVLVADYETTGTFAEPWANYVAAMYAVAAADAGVTILDLSLRVYTANGTDPYGIFKSADAVPHPSDEGHSLIADESAKFLIGASHASGHAALHAAGGQDDMFAFGGHSYAGRVEPVPRWAISSFFNLGSGTALFTYLTPSSDLTVSSLMFCTRSTAAATITLARLGLYTVDASGNLTLVARTASDTTLGNATNTLFTRSFDTTGGYPATYKMKAGVRYAIGLLFVGTTMPNACGYTVQTSGLVGLAPVMGTLASAQADLATSYATGALSNNGSVIWTAAA